mgnify:FL=1
MSESTLLDRLKNRLDEVEVSEIKLQAIIDDVTP